MNWGQIELTQGQIAIVSSEDFEGLARFNWFAVWTPSTKSYYAARNSPRVNGKQTMILMHRSILDAPRGMVVDHVNHNTLDNRRGNIRLATVAQNCCNTRLSRANSSGCKGAFRRDNGRWQSHIRANGKSIHLGTFATKEEAHAAYSAASKSLHGEFGRAA